MKIYETINMFKFSKDELLSLLRDSLRQKGLIPPANDPLYDIYEWRVEMKGLELIVHRSIKKKKSKPYQTGDWKEEIK